MNVLIGCEKSGVVREAFRARGHNAFSCDLEYPDDDSKFHLRGDVFWAIEKMGPWDLMIVHPPCTYLAVSGIHWNNRIPGRREKSEEALEFVRALLSADIPHIALENPVGIISTHIRKPDQYIQPWMFGHPYSKKTGLWLKKVPPLMASAVCIPPAYQENGKPRWLNQTPTGQNNLGPSPTRAAQRSRTYEGIAAAMAHQWGGLE